MKVEQKIVGVSIILGIFIWIADAAVDAIFFGKMSFLDELIFRVPAFEIYIRAGWAACFVAVSLVISKIIVKQRRTEAVLMEREETLHTVTNTAKDAIVIMDKDGYISFWNPAAEKIFGYAAHEAMGKELHSFIGPQRYYEYYQKGFVKFKQSGGGLAVGKTMELQALKKDGTEFPIELSLSAIQIRGAWHAAGIIRDITGRKIVEKELRMHREQLEGMVKERTAELTKANKNLQMEIAERKQAEEALQHSERFLNTIFESIRDPFSIIDRDYRIVKANAAYAQMRDKKIKELIGNRCYEVLQNKDSVCDDCLVEKTFKSADPCAKDKLLTFLSGSLSWMEIYTYPIFDEEGAVTHVIEYTRDITDRKKSEEEKKRLIERLEYLSRTDSLTELLNRRALIDRLEYEIDRAKRYGSELSLILCDMDNFKEINDTHGHAVGDRVLKSVAETLNSALRDSDVAGRYGGDEFMVLLPETILSGAENLAERIRASIENIVFQTSENMFIRMSLSLGVTCFNAASEDINDIIKRADIALYSSKRAGRNKVYSIEP